MSKLYILHESGAPRHFEAIQYLEKKGKIKGIVYIEFNVLRKFFKGLIKLDFNRSIRAIRNLIMILYLIFLEQEKKIVLGMAPYDKFVFLANILKKKYDVYYFTSWPYWDKSQQPKNYIIGEKYLHNQWSLFLSDVKKVTVTKQARNSLVRQGFKDNIYNNPHCVDMDVFYPKKGFETEGKEKLNILYVGRIAENKGMFYIKKLIENLPEENYNFSIVGDGPDEFIIKDIVNLSNVNYYGRVNDNERLAEIYRSNDLFILPSYKGDPWEELFGIVLIEAMASGLAVISTDCVGPKEIIDDSINGFVIPQNDYKELEKKVIYLNNNIKILNKFKEESFKKAKNEYEIKVCAQHWYEIL